MNRIYWLLLSAISLNAAAQGTGRFSVMQNGISGKAVSREDALKNGKIKFEIKGTLKNIQLPVVYFNYSVDNGLVTDSAVVVNGAYSFTGAVNEYVPGILYPKRGAPRENSTAIYTDKGTVVVTSVDSLSNLRVIRGTEAQVDFQALKTEVQQITIQQNKLGREFQQLSAAKDEAGLNRVKKEMADLATTRRNAFKKYVLKNPASPLAVYALTNYAGKIVNVEEVAPLFASLPAALQETKMGKAIAGKLEVAKKIGVGRPAPAFTQNDTLGVPVSLASFKGKYVLIDFWASWCKPCRAENPNVVKAFDTYKDKGFTVLGVSLDRAIDHSKWVGAIHQDNLTWTHVSDLKFWENAVAKLYDVHSIPQNFLVDPNGIIIAKDLRGEALDAKLAELLAK